MTANHFDFKRPARPLAPALLLLCLAALPAGRPAGASEGTAVFNVRDFGATGKTADFAGVAIQKAVDACAAAGGGMVYLPPGDYTSGTIHLRSHVRFHIEAGATVHSVKDKTAFDKEALFFGEDLVNITIEGRGTVDGQAAYEWRPTAISMMTSSTRTRRRWRSSGSRSSALSPRPDQFGKLVLLLRCRDVRISGLASSIPRPGRSIPTAASGWSSTASISGPA